MINQATTVEAGIMEDFLLLGIESNVTPISPGYRIKLSIGNRLYGRAFLHLADTLTTSPMSFISEWSGISGHVISHQLGKEKRNNDV